MPLRRLLASAALAVAVAASAAAPGSAQPTCSAEGAACATSLGEYRVALPEGPAPPAGVPAVLFFHGAGGAGAQTLGDAGMVAAFLDRGWAVIAPDGTERPGGFGRGWSFHPARPAIRDEAAFTREVLDDAAARHGIDRDRVLLAGFSIGGSLVWYLACADPTIAAAYAPVGGAFWRPHPAMGACVGPVRLLHTHGWRDETVPLEGRPLRGGAILQGDVFHGLEILRDANGCAGLRADAYETDGPFWRRWWTRCAPGSALELALHPGGHSTPPEWGPLAVEWFERTVWPGEAG